MPRRSNQRFVQSVEPLFAEAGVPEGPDSNRVEGERFRVPATGEESVLHCRRTLNVENGEGVGDHREVLTSNIGQSDVQIPHRFGKVWEAYYGSAVEDQCAELGAKEGRKGCELPAEGRIQCGESGGETRETGDGR